MTEPADGPSYLPPYVPHAPPTKVPDGTPAPLVDDLVSTEFPPPGAGPYNAAPFQNDDRVRPWWGLADVLLGVPFIIVFALVGMVAGLPFISGDELSELVEGGGTVPLAILTLSLLGQQIGQGVWPLLVAKWKGRGSVRDWRLSFKAIDPLLGLGTAVIAVGLAAVAATVVGSLVNLADESEADNTQFLRDAEGTVWVYLLLVAVVIGAPLAEELFFRGLTLRAFEKRAGPVVAVIGSTVFFTLPHFIGSGLAGTLVLFASIGAVGAVLGTVTVVVGRLWPAIFAHMLFNGLGAAAALGWFDGVAGT